MIEDKDFLTNEQKDLIESTILSQSFPLFYASSTYDTGKDKMGYMSHIVLRRPEKRRNTNDNGINSDYYDFFKSILVTFCKKHKININKILRINVNLVFPTGIKSSGIHVDHDFEHKNLILYLTNNSGACTHILNDDKKTIIKSVIPEKYKAVCFGKKYHYIDIPNNKVRIVVVYTFTEKENGSK